MSIRTRAMIRLTIIVASVALVLSLVIALSISPGASAAEEVSPISQVVVENLNEQTQGIETQLGPSQPQMMNGDGDFWNGWWIMMPIMMVLFWGGVIALVVWGVRQFTQNNGRDRSPLDIAKERLAKGEISSDEFEEIRGDLA